MRRTIVIFIVMVAVMIITVVPCVATVTPYYESFCVYDAVSYALKYGDSPNFDYPYLGKEKGGDCTNFVSQCLLAGGMAENNDWGHTNSLLTKTAYRTFVNAPRLLGELKSRGYELSSFTSSHGSSAIPAGFNAAAGDVVMIDYTGDGSPDHSVLCLGMGSDGVQHYAAHSRDESDRSFSHLFNVYENHEIRLWVIHMTKTYALTDVTPRYVGKTISIYSYQTDKYMSCNTSQDTSSVNAVANRSTASTWEMFKVIGDDKGFCGLRAYNRNFMSACMNLSATDAPVRAAYGRNYAAPLSWEACKIYTDSSGCFYIQSMANGKFYQVYCNDSSYPVLAAGAAPSSWERLRITTY